MLRRKFINKLGLGATAASLPTTMLSFKSLELSGNTSKKLKFGIVADVHKDLMPDANDRLEKFVTEAINRNVDFVIQLGSQLSAEISDYKLYF